MNPLQKMLLIAILFVSTISIAQAQRGGGRNMDPAQMAEKQTAMMKDSLALSEAQVEKIASVNLAYAQRTTAARKTARENSDGDREAMRTKMRTTMQTLRTEQKAELKKYLTSEQFEKWEEIEANRRQQRGERGKRGRKGRKNKKDQEQSSENN